MVKIPTITSRVSPSGRVPEIRQDSSAEGIKARATMKIGESLISVGKVVADLEAKIANSRNSRQSNQATTAFNIKSTNTIAQAAEDQDIERRQFYLDEIESARTEFGGSISDEITRNDFQLRADLSAAKATVKIGQLFRVKEIDAGRATVIDSLDSLEQQYIGSTSTAEENNIIAEKNALLDRSILDGNFTREQIANKRDELDQLWAIAKARGDMDINAIATRLKLAKNGYRIKDPAKRRELEDAAEKVRKRNIEEAQFNLLLNQNNLEQEAAKLIVSGEIKNINDIENKKGVTPEFKKTAEALILSAAKIDPIMKARDFEEIVDDFLSLEINTEDKTKKTVLDIAKFRTKLMDKLAKGTITQAIYNTYLKKIESAFLNKLERTVDRGVETERTFFDFFNIWAEQKVPKDRRENARAFLKKSLLEVLEKNPDLKEDEMQKVTNQILTDFIKSDNTGLANLTELPNSVFDSTKGFDNVGNSKVEGPADFIFQNGKMIRSKKPEVKEVKEEE